MCKWDCANCNEKAACELVEDKDVSITWCPVQAFRDAESTIASYSVKIAESLGLIGGLEEVKAIGLEAAWGAIKKWNSDGKAGFMTLANNRICWRLKRFRDNKPVLIKKALSEGGAPPVFL